MGLEKLASAELGKARDREERNGSGGGEGHKVLRSWDKDTEEGRKSLCKGKPGPS